MSSLRTRRFRPGDEVEIRNIYVHLHQKRYAKLNSLELIRWKWLHAPAGPMHSWIIEAEQADGSWKMVGHHGLCPTRFTFGDEDFVCAKTSTSMLLPEFRDKFLYLRFEQQCLKEVEHRLDATYSCAAGTARLRRSLGYNGSSVWVHMVRGLQTPEVISRLLGLTACRYPKLISEKSKQAIVAISTKPPGKPPLEFSEHTSEDAFKSAFFADFWTYARQIAGMAPRRDAADLNWRFWQRPDFQYITLTYSTESGIQGYCVIDITDPLVFRLEDIYLVPLRPDVLEAFIKSLLVWCARKGALLLRFSTTNDGQPDGFLDVFARHMHRTPLRHFRPAMDFPRRVSKNSALKDKKQHSWNTTFMVMPA